MIKLTKPVAIRLTDKDAHKLRSLADENFITVSKYCRAVIKTHLEENNNEEREHVSF